MKVYFEGGNEFSYSIKKVEKYLKKYAPIEIQFTQNLEESDYQISHFISHIDRTRVPYRDKNYAVIYYCRDGWDDDIYNDSLDFFKRAKFIWSYADFNNLYPDHEAIFIESPLGVDPEIFKIKNLEKKYNIMTTGYVSSTEAIRECFDACVKLNTPFVHLGGELERDFGMSCKTAYVNHITYFNDVLDDDVSNLLNHSKWVAGLRHGEGFEFMNIEGALCGTRSICFDMNCYKKWFDDIPEYVPPVQGEELIEHIKRILEKGHIPITEVERLHILNKFSWEVVARNFWKNIMDSRG